MIGGGDEKAKRKKECLFPDLVTLLDPSIFLRFFVLMTLCALSSCCCSVSCTPALDLSVFCVRSSQETQTRELGERRNDDASNGSIWWLAELMHA
mmetsp:Transcript_10406/g.20204  ORF Transcript_10406/g.20204 Transcript_10406/m.20204 type:complete len:95 (-) Transcript_10406:765-1049(-)